MKKLLNWQHRAISFSAGVKLSLWVWSSGFLVQSLVFGGMNLGLSEFKCSPVKFEAIESWLYLGSI